MYSGERAELNSRFVVVHPRCDETASQAKTYRAQECKTKRYTLKLLVVVWRQSRWIVKLPSVKD